MGGQGPGTDSRRGGRTALALVHVNGNVGNALSRLLAHVERQDRREQQQQIDELMRRNTTNTTLLQQHEQRIEQLQRTINEQQTRLEAIKRNSTLLLAEQIQQLNSSTTAELSQHEHIRQINSKVDAWLTPTIVHAVASSEPLRSVIGASSHHCSPCRTRSFHKGNANRRTTLIHPPWSTQGHHEREAKGGQQEWASAQHIALTEAVSSDGPMRRELGV